MGVIRKILGVIFSLAGLLCLAAFALTWYGPWVREASRWMSFEWYYWAVAVLAGITAIGLIVTLIRSLVSKRVDNVVVNQLDGGQVTITRDAVASLTTKIVEADGTCIADTVQVSAKPKGDIRVKVRVQPIATIPVMEKGAELTAEIRQGLAALCGNQLAGVELTFTEPQNEYYDPAAQAASQVQETYQAQEVPQVQAIEAPVTETQVYEMPAPSEVAADVQASVQGDASAADISSSFGEV